jgi:UDP-N-acetylglucosamine 2-epimerase (non-hydrolysing)
MLDQVLSFFKVIPDYDLNVMTPNQTLSQLSSKILINMEKIFFSYKPDLVLVHGDTTTAMVVSLSSFYNGFKVAHVEAGLRTYDKLSPYPEEVNRNVISKIADYHFAPTETSFKNLIAEGINKKNIIITGNTVIDALNISSEIIQENWDKNENIGSIYKKLNYPFKFILVTVHRRENLGEGILNICNALLEISIKTDYQIIFPVHLNPSVKEPVTKLLNNSKNILLLEPQPYESFVWLMMNSYLVLTDSGGIQEEAPTLKKPVIVLRETTERPEAILAGTVKLVGSDKDKIVKEVLKLVNNKNYYSSMATGVNPYGDGKASQRIYNHIRKSFKNM